MAEYEELLKKAYGEMPKKSLAKERFEPPPVESFIQGNKTIIRNFDVITTKLRRTPAILAKFFTKELAVPNAVDGGRLILQGKFSDRVLNERLLNFIDRFVMCKECKRPDTNISEEGGVKILVCEACGARSPVK